MYVRPETGRQRTSHGLCVWGCLVSEKPGQRTLSPTSLLLFIRPSEIAELPWLHFPARLPGGLSQNLELLSRMFTHKHFMLSVQVRLSDLRKPLCGSARLQLASEQAPRITPRVGATGHRRLEVSGCSKVKVKPRTAGKATQGACPTDPQSEA